MNNSVAVIVALCCAGCVTTSDKSMAVQIHQQDSTLVSGCKKLGPVSAHDSSAWGFGIAVENAKTLTREKVADLGGDSLVITNIDYYDGGALVHGLALRCYDGAATKPVEGK